MEDTPSWVSVIVVRIGYLYDMDTDDAVIRKSILEIEPAYFWTSRRRLLLELMICEFSSHPEAGRERKDIPFL